MPPYVRNVVRDLVDGFINAYSRVNQPSASVAAPSSASPRSDLICQVQKRLQTTGYPPGTIDGSIGPQTRDALRGFQSSKACAPPESLMKRP